MRYPNLDSTLLTTNYFVEKKYRCFDNLKSKITIHPFKYRQYLFNFKISNCVKLNDHFCPEDFYWQICQFWVPADFIMPQIYHYKSLKYPSNIFIYHLGPSLAYIFQKNKNHSNNSESTYINSRTKQFYYSFYVNLIWFYIIW